MGQVVGAIWNRFPLVLTIGPLKMQSLKSAININRWPLMPIRINGSTTARWCFQPQRISKPMAYEPSSDLGIRSDIKEDDLTCEPVLLHSLAYLPGAAARPSAAAKI